MKYNLRPLSSSLAVALLLAVTAGCTHAQQPAVQEPRPVAPPAAPAVQFVELTADNIDKEVLESTLPVLMVVCHKDRGACKMEEPILQQVAAEYKGRVKFAHLEMSEQAAVAVAMGIKSAQDLPTHVLFKAGEVVGGYRGVLDADELRMALDRLLAAKVKPEPKPQHGDGGTTKL